MSPASVHIGHIDGWTPLHWAASRGNHHALGLLLENTADPFCPTENKSKRIPSCGARKLCSMSTTITWLSNREQNARH